MVAGRDLATLPKAHLHLHFTGSLSVPTLVSLADARDIELPGQLVDSIALDVPADKRGWYRFQRFYDIARAAVQGEDALRTVVRAAAAEDAAEGSRRLELQVDPTSYASSVGGLQPALEIICDEARSASAAPGREDHGPQGPLRRCSRHRARPPRSGRPAGPAGRGPRPRAPRGPDA